jgi:hypothetical protein
MKDQPVPTVVRCRERRQDVAPVVEGLVYQHPQRYLVVGARSSVHTAREGRVDDGKRRWDRLGV